MKGDLLMGFENKQTLLFRLYQVLFDYSDENNLLTQQDIIDILEREYGLVVERKGNRAQYILSQRDGNRRRIKPQGCVSRG